MGVSRWDSCETCDMVQYNCKIFVGGAQLQQRNKWWTLLQKFSWPDMIQRIPTYLMENSPGFKARKGEHTPPRPQQLSYTYTYNGLNKLLWLVL